MPRIVWPRLRRSLVLRVLLFLVVLCFIYRAREPLIGGLDLNFDVDGDLDPTARSRSRVRQEDPNSPLSIHGKNAAVDSQAKVEQALQKQRALRGGKDEYLVDGGGKKKEGTQRVQMTIDVVADEPKGMGMPVVTTEKGGVYSETTTATSSSSSSSTSTSTSSRSTPTTSTNHWKKPLQERYPVHSSDLIALPTLPPKPLPRIQHDFSRKQKHPEAENTRQQRLAAVRHAAKTSWEAYKTFAMGHDVLRPESATYRDTHAGWGETLVESLDALWIMGMRGEFEDAVREVGKIDFTTTPVRDDIPVFETVVRYLGGLLGAYDVSGGQYQGLIDKAMELAELLHSAFDTPNRMPVLNYHWTCDWEDTPQIPMFAGLGELASLSIEFTRLAQITKQDRFYDSIARITDALEELQPRTGLPGLWPLALDVSRCPTARQTMRIRPRKPTQLEKCPLKEALEFGHYHIGAQAGSAYEYLPKEWILLGGVEHKYQTMYMRAIEAMKKHLHFRPMIPETQRNLSFFAAASAFRGGAAKEWAGRKGVTQDYKGTHLTCSAGAMVGLAARAFELPREDLDLAASLTDGCIWAYSATKTGVMPEEFDLLPCESPMRRECSWDAERFYRAIDPSAQDTYEYMMNQARDALADADEFLYAGGENRKNNRDVSSSKPAPPKQAKVNDNHNDNDRPKARQNSEPVNAEAWRLAEEKTAMEWNIDQRIFHELRSWEEYAQFRQSQMRLPDGMTHIYPSYYLLRPEAIESVFYMYRLTGEDYWRERGWDMWQAIMAATRTNVPKADGQANSGIFDVMDEGEPGKTNIMESFWIAKTCKYFYLLFSEEEIISLDDYVFNTEAHPFKIPKP